MTFKQFQESGKMSPVNDDMRIKLKLSPECSDILQYKDGAIIQSLKSGGFIYSDKKSGDNSNIYCSKLDPIEGIVYNLRHPENKC